MTRLLNILLLLLITSLSFSQTHEEIDNAQGLMNYWQQLINAGKYNEAIKHTDKLTFYDESHRLYLKGTICNAMKDEESAEKYFSASLKEDPLNSDAAWGLAIIMYNKALEQLQKANKADNNDYQREMDVATLAFKEAIPYLEKSVELDYLSVERIKTLVSTKKFVVRNDEDYAKIINKQQETRKLRIAMMEKEYTKLCLISDNTEDAAKALCGYAYTKNDEWDDKEAYLVVGIVLEEKKHYGLGAKSYGLYLDGDAQLGSNRALALAGAGYCEGQDALQYYQENKEDLQRMIIEKNPERLKLIEILYNTFDNASFLLDQSLELEDNEELRVFNDSLIKYVDYFRYL